MGTRYSKLQQGQGRKLGVLMQTVLLHWMAADLQELASWGLAGAKAT